MDTPSSRPLSPGAGASTSQSLVTPDSGGGGGGGEKRKRQPRNSACQGCASLKMKCISTANGKCERCNRMDRECVPAIPKPRKRRTQSNVGESEGIPLLEFGGASPATPQGPPPRFDPPSAKQPEYQAEAERGTLLARHDLSHTDSKSFVSLFSRGLGNIAACEDLLRGIDYNFVASSFTVFRQLTPFFPFIELSPGADVVAMVAGRPVLTLAVCSVAAAAHPEVQSRLSQAFRYALSSKVILGSERSMDVLTGLLVFLAWHHHYMSQHQLYQQLSLLAGMTADLGLYRPWMEPTEPSVALERDRAMVGVYYLCCTLSATGFDRPNPLRWTSNLRGCAERAATNGGLPSDRTLVSLLELAKAINDMEDGLRQLSEAQRPVPVQFVDLHTKAASQRLKALKREHQALGGSLEFTSASIHIYQRHIRASELSDYPMLIQCACAIKEYVDDLLARPPATLHRLAISDWTSLLEVLVLMARVSKPVPSTGGWEAGALTSMLQPEQMLDSVCAHMAAAPANDPLSPRHEALLQSLRSVCDGIKRRILHGPGTQRAEDEQAADGGFRAVNESVAVRSSGPPPFDALNFSGSGILDASFWTSLIG